jgi:hypothetical protein
MRESEPMRESLRIVARAALLACASLACAAAIAAEIVGSVLAVRGEAFSDAGGVLQPLVANAPVAQGATIVTHDGKAKIALEDGSIVSVGENTRVRIGMEERKPRGVKAGLALVSGALRLLVRATPSGSFEVETETAIAAVRGTEWIMEAASAQTSVALLRGRVSVAGREGGSAVVLQNPGHGTDVKRGAAPTPPIPWGRRRIADLLARATFN